MIFSSPAAKQALTDHLMSRIKQLLHIEDEDTIATKLGHNGLELSVVDKSPHYKFLWISFRLNDQYRMIGVLPICLKTGQRHFFALQITPHDYQKTPIKNKASRESKQNQIESFLQQQKTPEATEESYHPQLLINHQKAFKKLNPKQCETVEELLIKPRAICIGPPGTGKSALATELAEHFSTNGDKVCYVTPIPMLAINIQAEIEETCPNSVISYDDFLKRMDRHYPGLDLVNAEKKPTVDFHFFENWYHTTIKFKVDRYGLIAYWQELTNVILQPDWKNPKKICLTLDEYKTIGKRQSLIPEDDRESLYSKVFMPFLKRARDTSKCYFNIEKAQSLYLALTEQPLAIEDRVDILIADEFQKWDPWAWACLINTVKNGLNGRYYFFGDPHQGVEAQPLRLLGNLKECIKPQPGAFTTTDVPVLHLSSNHRNSKPVAELVQRLFAIEEAVLGSLERDGITKLSPPASTEGGVVELVNPSQDLSRHIAENAGSYVIIPNETWLERAKLLFPEHSIVTVRQFSGMSAQCIVLFGYPEEYHKEWNTFQTQLASREVDFSESTSFRRAKVTDSSFYAMRYAIQSLATAAARAEIQLSIVAEGEHHPFIRQVTHPDAALQKPVVITKTTQPSTSQDWLLRAKHDFNGGLTQQAFGILQNPNYWPSEKHQQIISIFQDNGLTKETFDLACNVLDTTNSAEQHGQMLPPHRVQKIMASEAPQPQNPMEEKWTGRIKDELSRITKDPSINNLDALIIACQEGHTTLNDLLASLDPIDGPFLRCFLNTHNSASLLQGLSTDARSKFPKPFRELVTNDPKDKKSQNVQVTVLDYCLRHHTKEEKVKKLLEAGAKPTRPGMNSTLYLAIKNKYSPAILERILSADKPDAKDLLFPLMLAICKKRNKILSILLEAGAPMLFGFKSTELIINDLFPGFSKTAINQLLIESRKSSKENSDVITISATDYALFMQNKEAVVVLEAHFNRRKDIVIDSLAKKFALDLLTNFDEQIIPVLETVRNSSHENFFEHLFKTTVCISDKKTTLERHLIENRELFNKLIYRILNSPFSKNLFSKLTMLFENCHPEKYSTAKDIEKYFSKMNWNKLDDYPLPIAISSIKYEIAKKLLDLGADPKIGHSDIYDSLCWAIYNHSLESMRLPDSLELINLLIVPNANLNGGSNSIVRPLSLAAARNAEVIFELLLEKGADPFFTPSPSTLEPCPKHVINEIAFRCNPKILEIVLRHCKENGKDINTPDANGFSVTHAIMNEHCTIKILEMLKDAGADFSMVSNPEGEPGKSRITPLFAATQSQRVDLIGWLLDEAGGNAKGSLNYQSEDGATVIHYAIDHKGSDALEALLNADPDLNLTNDRGVTALFHAIYSGNIRNISLLYNKDPAAAKRPLNVKMRYLIETCGTEAITKIDITKESSDTQPSTIDPDLIVSMTPEKFAIIHNNPEVLELFNIQSQAGNTNLFLSSHSMFAPPPPPAGPANQNASQHNSTGSTSTDHLNP